MSRKPQDGTAVRPYLVLRTLYASCKMPRPYAVAPALASRRSKERKLRNSGISPARPSWAAAPGARRVRRLDNLRQDIASFRHSPRARVACLGAYESLTAGHDIHKPAGMQLRPESAATKTTSYLPPQPQPPDDLTSPVSTKFSDSCLHDHRPHCTHPPRRLCFLTRTPHHLI